MRRTMNVLLWVLIVFLVHWLKDGIRSIQGRWLVKDAVVSSLMISPTTSSNWATEQWSSFHRAVYQIRDYVKRSDYYSIIRTTEYATFSVILDNVMWRTRRACVDADLVVSLCDSAFPGTRTGCNASSKEAGTMRCWRTSSSESRHETFFFWEKNIPDTLWNRCFKDS